MALPRAGDPAPTETAPMLPTQDGMRRNATEPKDEGAISNCQAQNVNLGLQLLSVALPTDEHKIIAGTYFLARAKLLI